MKHRAMTPLQLTLPAFPYEPALSLASRIAMKHGIAPVSDLVSDLGANWTNMNRGRKSAIEHFARIVGADGSQLVREAFLPRPERRFEFRGHLLDRPVKNRSYVRLCPRCIVNDYEQGGRLARHSRAHWQLAQFRTCPEHNVPILALPSGSALRYTVDFAQIIEDQFQVIQSAAEGAETRSADFETWLLRRLAGRRTGHWLDQLETSVVALLCEKAGAALTFGAQATPSQLDEGELSIATEAAFQSLFSSDKGLEPLLIAIWEERASDRSGHYAAFGIFGRWLEKVKTDLRYERILDEAAEFVFNHHPIPEGETIYGRNCKERKFHTVSSAATEYGLNISRAERILKKMTGNSRSLAVEDVDTLLSGISSHLPRVQAAKRLGVSGEMFDRFKRIDLVRSVVRMENVAEIFDVGELDSLREAVFRRVQMLQSLPPRCSPIAAAAGAVSLPSEMIIEMLAQQKIEFVGQLPGSENMYDLIVSRDELRRIVFGPEIWPPEGQLTLSQARAALKLNASTVAWLVREGYLLGTQCWRPSRRQHCRLFAFTEIDRFAGKYVSLGSLAAEAGIQANHVARRLERQGIYPLGFPSHLSKIYLREAVHPPDHVGRPTHSPSRERDSSVKNRTK